MSSLILGMIGAILICAAYKSGFYFGQKQKVTVEKEELDEVVKLERERLTKGVNNILYQKRSDK